MASKIIIVEREEGNPSLSEQTFFDKDLGCEYTVIRTDNFKLLFGILSEINQGIHPAEVRKYQHVIKELIIDRGKRGSLNTLLISPEELNDIERRIGDEKLVVALGDTTYIFQMPDLISYLYNYFIEERLIHTDIALRFIASQNNNSRIPFIKHVKDKDLDSSNLHPVDIEKIKQRINKFTNPNVCIDTIHQSYKIRARSLDEILEQNYRVDKEYDVIAYNALRIDKLHLERYIKDKIVKYKNAGVRSLSPYFRRLVTIYDLIVNLE